jgi:hypothetical protein
MSAIPVIILQTSGSGFFEAEEGLTRSGLKRFEDYALHSEAGIVLESDIIPGEEQLFITGTINGSREEACELVRKLKEKNSRLLAASFSMSPMIGPPFDHAILKEGHNYPELIETIKSFLAGSLKKQTV